MYRVYWSQKQKTNNYIKNKKRNESSRFTREQKESNREHCAENENGNL